MLKRLYADNFRCLVNFELKLDPVNLLLGENGTGKTTVFDVLYRLQQFLAGNAKVLAVFPSTELTRWQTNSAQRFELDLEVGKANYAYSLLIEHDDDRRKGRIKSETLLLDGKAVLISHHPEIIDHLALPAGRWFDRDNNGPARVTDKPKAQVEGLKPSETMARGWEL